MSKTLAERAAWQLANSPGAKQAQIELSVINPTYVFGPQLTSEVPLSTSVRKIKNSISQPILI
jgi:hypothetical protein